jgi:D-glycero-D-manno-heptose 1,7-bisphosphate phosphatase
VTSQPAVFLDRDGVVNRAEVRNGVPQPPARLEDFALLPGVVEAVRRLRYAGFAVVIVTNQPDVARGDQRRSVVEAMNEGLRQALEPDRIVVCYHDDADGCECRKPAPGMLLAAAEDMALDLATSFMVGDRWRDIDAGRRAGCRTIFVDRGCEERRPENPDAVVADLPEAVTWIIAHVAKKKEEEARLA